MTAVTMDKPISCTITKTINAGSSCKITYANPSGKFTNFLKPTDIVRIYIGLDTTYPIPIFTGYIHDWEIQTETGNFTVVYTLHDMIATLKDYYVTLNDDSNYDGWEAMMIIKDIFTNTIFADMPFASTDNVYLKGTNPRVIFSDEKERANANVYAGRLRYEKGTDCLSLVQEILSKCVDREGNSTGIPYRYAIYSMDNKLYSRKMGTIVAGSTSKTIEYQDNMLASNIRYKMTDTLNDVSYYGAEYDSWSDIKKDFVKKTYTGNRKCLSSIYSYGRTMKYETDDSLDSINKCRDRAYEDLALHRTPTINATFQITELFMANPGDAISISNIPFGLEDDMRIQELKIEYTPTNIRTFVTCGARWKVITDYL